MHPHLPHALQHVHRTTTYASAHHPVWPYGDLPAGPAWAHATCRCGWAEVAESDRDARVLARHHRRYAADHPTYLPGAALRIGGRAHQADATATHVSTTGTRHGWALADGIGDSPLAAHAAGSAAATAAYVAADRGTRTGLLAATGTLAAVLGGDTVMVVATPLPAERGDGWDIAWVGDCRAYEYDHVTGILTQLTADHTHGQQLREGLAERYRDRPADLEALAAGQDNIVTSSVATAADDTLGHVTTTGPRRRLLLTSDGVHKPVPYTSLLRAVQTFSDPAACANRLTLAARYFGGTDNAAAMVIDPVPAPIPAELVP
jgi:serine/threonine protein phosphatase PrpC